MLDDLQVKLNCRKNILRRRPIEQRRWFSIPFAAQLLSEKEKEQEQKVRASGMGSPGADSDRQEGCPVVVLTRFCGDPTWYPAQLLPKTGASAEHNSSIVDSRGCPLAASLAGGKVCASRGTRQVRDKVHSSQQSPALVDLQLLDDGSILREVEPWLVISSGVTDHNSGKVTDTVGAAFDTSATECADCDVGYFRRGDVVEAAVPLPLLRAAEAYGRAWTRYPSPNGGSPLRSPLHSPNRLHVGVSTTIERSNERECVRGRVLRDHRDGTYDIQMTDGQEVHAVRGRWLRHALGAREMADCRVANSLRWESVLVIGRQDPPYACAESKHSHDQKKGSSTRCRGHGGQGLFGQYRVVFDDGRQEMGVDARRLMPPRRTEIRLRQQQHQQQQHHHQHQQKQQKFQHQDGQSPFNSRLDSLKDGSSPDPCTTDVAAIYGAACGKSKMGRYDRSDNRARREEPWRRLDLSPATEEINRSRFTVESTPGRDSYFYPYNDSPQLESQSMYPQIQREGFQSMWRSGEEKGGKLVEQRSAVRPPAGVYVPTRPAGLPNSSSIGCANAPLLSAARGLISLAAPRSGQGDQAGHLPGIQGSDNCADEEDMIQGSDNCADEEDMICSPATVCHPRIRAESKEILYQHLFRQLSGPTCVMPSADITASAFRSYSPSKLERVAVSAYGTVHST